jgi:hypothetical protein
VKLLWPRDIVWSKERLLKIGKEPLSELLWRSIWVRLVRVLMLRGSVPVSELDGRMIDVTAWVVELHEMPFHLQWWVLLDHPMGVGFSACKRSDMYSASSYSAFIVAAMDIISKRLDNKTYPWMNIFIIVGVIGRRCSVVVVLSNVYFIPKQEEKKSWNHCDKEKHTVMWMIDSSHHDDTIELVP